MPSSGTLNSVVPTMNISPEPEKVSTLSIPETKAILRTTASIEVGKAPLTWSFNGSFGAMPRA